MIVAVLVNFVLLVFLRYFIKVCMATHWVLIREPLPSTKYSVFSIQYLVLITEH